jgi:hypothetical protein
MTTSTKFPRPVTGDCAQYYFTYIDKVGDEDIVSVLEQQQTEFGDFISSLTAEQLAYRYAPGKWSMAQSIGHILDTERIFSYRCLCISRGEQKPLPGFEQDDFVANSRYDLISAAGLAAEWNAIRSATILMCHHMTPEMAQREGVASEKPLKAYAVPYILAGHVNHHMIIFRERYLQPAAV